MAALLSVLWAFGGLGAAVDEVPGFPGYVFQPAFAIDEEIHPPLQPYQPQAGDMFFSTDKMWIIRFGHKLAGAHAPHHSGHHHPEA